MQAQTSI